MGNNQYLLGAEGNVSIVTWSFSVMKICVNQCYETA
jgi:hypothetical protein